MEVGKRSSWAYLDRQRVLRLPFDEARKAMSSRSGVKSFSRTRTSNPLNARKLEGQPFDTNAQ